MPILSLLRASVCHRRVACVIGVAMTLAACGGSVFSPAASDGGSPGPTNGCPSNQDIASGAALGGACSPEGTYCADLSCDPCRSECRAVSCTRGAWTTAVDTALCTGDAGGGDASVIDAAPVCMTLDPRSFDQTCAVTADCIAVTGGTFCSGQMWCMCPGETINAADKASYEAALQNIESTLQRAPGGCSCPFFGSPWCNMGHCALCGGASGGACPDGG
jgi:hypothetical protein